MKKMTLTKGNQILELKFDDEDFEFFKDKRVYINTSRGKNFAYVRLNVLKSVMIQRHLMGEPDMKIMFLDGDTLNFCKSNLKLKDETFKKNRKESKRILDRKDAIKRAQIYYYHNKEKVKKYQKDYRKRNPEKVAKRSERSLVNRPIKKDPVTQNIQKKFNRAKTTAARRLLCFTLSFEQYKELILKGCFYTNETLFDKGGTSLDRIDNTRGYTFDNVVPCVCWVNRMRGNHLTVEETKAAVDAVLKIRNSDAK